MVVGLFHSPSDSLQTFSRNVLFNTVDWRISFASVNQVCPLTMEIAISNSDMSETDPGEVVSMIQTNSDVSETDPGEVMSIIQTNSDMSETDPGEEVMSIIQALHIRGVKDKDMQKVIAGVLENYEVKEWEGFLAAGPNALNAIGQCFFVALSGNAGQIYQKKDKTMYASLAILLTYHEIKLIIYPQHQSGRPADKPHQMLRPWTRNLSGC